MRFILVLIAASTVNAFGASVSDFSALHGCWTGAVAEGNLQESYSSVNGNMMFGHTQIIDASGNTLGWGMSTISQKNDDVIFTYSDNGAASSVFKLSKFTRNGDSFTASFTNDASDTYQRVDYAVQNGQVLTIHVEGKMGGNPFNFDLVANKLTDSTDCP
jgi:hypothetical protein